jgi:hypothetical protein
MIISIGIETAFDKISYSFMIKDLKKVGAEGMYLGIITVVYDKHIVGKTLIGKN